MFGIRIFLISFVLKWACCNIEVPVVQTEFGPVRGVYEENEHGQFISYMGIPFGKHPPGNVFGDPVDPLPWTDILEANDGDVVCPQREEFNNTLVGHIDCLKLNVYVPANRTSKHPLPVFYFIYGGAFKKGFAGKYVWGPFKLVRHEIILVIANYRVGPFGFLCLGTKDVPGNAGLKDARKGLEWVKKNIEHFEGDQNAITLGGSSSGAMMVEQLIVSPTTDHLFERAILESGSVHNSRFNAYADHTDDVLKMATYFGYKTDSVKKAVDYLQTIKPLDLTYASEKLKIKFMQCIEPKIDGMKNFLTDFPARYFENGNFTSVNMITGFNTVELPIATLQKQFYDTSENMFFNVLRLLNPPEKDFEHLTNAVRYFYIGSQAVSDKVKEEMSNFYSDATLTYPIIRSANQHRSKAEKVYLYEFGYSGNRNFALHQHGINSSNAMHADEIGYLFEQPYWTTKLTSSDQLISDRMTTMWTNFIKYGDPTPNVTELLPIKWHPMGEKRDNYLHINTEMKALGDPLKERMSFWDMIYYHYYRMNYANAKIDDYEF